MAKIIVVILCSILLTQCTSKQVKKDSSNEDDVSSIIDAQLSKAIEQENLVKEEFLSLPKKKGEKFRFFISSTQFTKKNYSKKEHIKVKIDPSGDADVSSEIAKLYDKINKSFDARVKLELYPDSGKISRVRFLASTGVTEIDKLISDDVSRLVFKFHKNIIEPTNFNLSYRINLKNRLTHDQAYKYLKKYVKKKKKKKK